MFSSSSLTPRHSVNGHPTNLCAQRRRTTLEYVVPHGEAFPLIVFLLLCAEYRQRGRARHDAFTQGCAPPLTGGGDEW